MPATRSSQHTRHPAEAVSPPSNRLPLPLSPSPHTRSQRVRRLPSRLRDDYECTSDPVEPPPSASNHRGRLARSNTRARASEFFSPPPPPHPVVQQPQTSAQHHPSPHPQGHLSPQPPDRPQDLDPDAEETFWGGAPAQPPQILAEDVAVNSQPPLQQAALRPQVPLPSFEEASQVYIPTLKWPPRPVRADFTRTLADLWQQVADKPAEVQGWLLIFIFTRAVLPAGIAGNQDQAESKSKLIRERLRRWRQGEFSALWSEAVQLSSKRPKAKKKKASVPEKSQQDLNVERATKLCQEGQYTKSLQALVSLGLAEHSPAVLKEMQAKHPQGAPPLIPTTDSSPIAFSPSQVLEACQTFHKGSAAGPRGLRPEHLMIMLKSSPANRVAKAETQLTRLCSS